MARVALVARRIARPHVSVARVDKLLQAMRRNPRGDWRIEQLIGLVERYQVPYRWAGGSHVVFVPRGSGVLSVPAARPIKPVYVRQFVRMIDGVIAGAKR